MMNDIFKDLIDKGYVAIYMDDPSVYTRMIQHHREDSDLSPWLVL